jgi:hypothetical protein
MRAYQTIYVKVIEEDKSPQELLDEGRNFEAEIVARGGILVRFDETTYGQERLDV